jgi:hypothetical protein
MPGFVNCHNFPIVSLHFWGRLPWFSGHLPIFLNFWPFFCHFWYVCDFLDFWKFGKLTHPLIHPPDTPTDTPQTHPLTHHRHTPWHSWVRGGYSSTRCTCLPQCPVHFPSPKCPDGALFSPQKIFKHDFHPYNPQYMWKTHWIWAL